MPASTSSGPQTVCKKWEIASVALVIQGNLAPKKSIVSSNFGATTSSMPTAKPTRHSSSINGYASATPTLCRDAARSRATDKYRVSSGAKRFDSSPAVMMASKCVGSRSRAFAKASAGGVPADRSFATRSSTSRSRRGASSARLRSVASSGNPAVTASESKAAVVIVAEVFRKMLR